MRAALCVSSIEAWIDGPILAPLGFAQPCYRSLDSK